MTTSRSHSATLNLQLPSALEMLSQESRTVLLRVVVEGMIASIYMDRGRVVHATCPGLRGEEALFACIQWNDGSFYEEEYEAPPEITISDSVTHLLLRAAQWEDEEGRMVVSEQLDLDSAVKVGENVWWVGHRKEGSPLQVNVYLKKFEAPGKPSIWLLIDPGSQLHYPEIAKRIYELVDMSKIQLYSLNHQDPDLCTNVQFMLHDNPHAVCITTSENSRLLAHYGVKNFRLVDSQGWQIKLVTGHRLRFFPTPFCHAPGAFGIYDQESEIIFTGDLLGGTSIKHQEGPLYARPEDWDDVELFHQLYFPCNDALVFAMNQIRDTIGSAHVTIAPQHGGVINPHLAEEWMERLKGLKVGMDLRKLSQTDVDKKRKYLECINETVSFAISLLSRETVQQRIAASRQLPSSIEFNAKLAAQNVFGEPHDAMKMLLGVLLEGASKGIVGALRASVARALRGRRLPPLSEEETEEGEVFDETEDLFADETL